MRRLTSIFLIVTLLGVGIPTVFRTIHRRFVGVASGVILEGQSMENYYQREVRIIVEEMARKQQREPKNATIDKQSGQFIPEEEGVHIDVDETVYQVMEARSNTELSLVKVSITPPFRLEHLEQITETLGSFSTALMGSPARVKNIRLSLEALNNTLLHPGEVFSFNGVVGERTVEKGYGPAPIFLGESVVPGVGGGVCQTSSTLYNAVKRADLEIVERKIHSRPPSYIQHGKDAAVAWPYTDFQFRNNRDTPIIVKGGVEGWRARTWILGVPES